MMTLQSVVIDKKLLKLIYEYEARSVGFSQINFEAVALTWGKGHTDPDLKLASDNGLPVEQRSYDSKILSIFCSEHFSMLR